MQIEYKLRLRAHTPDKFNKLVTQLKWRLYEGELSVSLSILPQGELRLRGR